MLSFKEISEKKSKVVINPKLEKLKEKKGLGNCGEDCDCMKCEKKRRMDDVNDGPDVANESAVPGKPAEKLKTDRNMFSIDKDERSAAAERLRAKTAAKRKANLKKEEAYVSQEEVSEESDQGIEEKETTNLLTFEDFVAALDKVNEEGADSLKDRRMERGGVDGNNRYNKPISNTPNTFGKKKPKYDGMSALDKVKANIEKQYGKGAIMDTKKKK